MVEKSYGFKKCSLILSRFIPFVSLLMLIFLASGASPNKNLYTQTNVKFDPFKYLPHGARIENQNKNVVFADLDGDGHQEVIIFYMLRNGDDHKANILALKPNGSDYIRLWENTFDGSWGFADPSGVYNLNRSSGPQIIAYRAIGAGCPGVLDIYHYQSGTVVKISGDWEGKCESDLEIKDLDADGVFEIIFRTLKYGVNPDIYRWNGKRYVRSNSRFPEYYNDELEKLIRAIYSRDLLPASARLMWANQIVQIYLIQKRYDDAIRLCKAVLRIIHDPGQTQSDRTEVQAKAAIYRLIADTYKAEGNLQQAQKHYQKAQNLEQPTNR